MHTIIPIPFRLLVLCAALAAGLSAVPAQADEAPRARPAVETDPETGLREWQWDGEGLSVEMGQLLPDQVRAFFIGRGFEDSMADRVAQRCAFWGSIGNTGREGSVKIDLGQWRTHGSGGTAPLLLNSHWQRKWEEEGVPRGPRTAFRWTVLPAEHRFAPQDWLMGMIVIDRPPGADFDLELRWREGDEQRRRILPGLSCAPE
ncbi:MAG: hypothetical protein ACLFQ3_04250 [Thiohalorhabdus sp.]